MLYSLKREKFSRLGELLSPRRELEQWNSGAFTFSRLDETSSPERDGFSLKTRARRLSDSSRKHLREFLILSHRRDPLIWAKKPEFLQCSHMHTSEYSPIQHVNQSQSTQYLSNTFYTHT